MSAWGQVPIVWLSGVRRVGKTTLARAIEQIEYFDCDLPSTRREVADPEAFFRSFDGKRPVVFDEVHRLEDASSLLKIGADHFPHLRLLATGSSTLAATRKFRDSLTGRKRTVHMTPALWSELPLFKVQDVRRRLALGGLPEVLLSGIQQPGFYSEWLDSFYARDVQELFHVEKRHGFLKLVELVLRNSGCGRDASQLAAESGLSRPTVLNYLEVLETTHLIYPVRPYHGGGVQELMRQERIYGFDTGFVVHVRGWNELRPPDCGGLWEHLVLIELLAALDNPRIHYWRDKQGHEVDFVIPCGRDACAAIECKWDPDEFSPANLMVFRKLHPRGLNLVVSPRITRGFERSKGDLRICYLNLAEAVQRIQAPRTGKTPG